MNRLSLFRAASSIQPSLNRTFTSSAALFNNKSNGLRLTPRERKLIPEYPYGPARWFKQADKGLLGGQKIMFGNKVAEKSEKTSRRKWKVNTQMLKLYSTALGQEFRMRTTPRVLKTIDKCGGLDNYLLGGKAARIKELGVTGWALRWKIMQTPHIQERFRKEMKSMGVELEPGMYGYNEVVETDAELRRIEEELEEARRAGSS